MECVTLAKSRHAPPISYVTPTASANKHQLSPCPIFFLPRQKKPELRTAAAAGRQSSRRTHTSTTTQVVVFCSKERERERERERTMNEWEPTATNQPATTGGGGLVWRSSRSNLPDFCARCNFELIRAVWMRGRLYTKERERERERGRESFFLSSSFGFR
jgi:hypothetical protein